MARSSFTAALLTLGAATGLGAQSFLLEPTHPRRVGSWTFDIGGQMGVPIGEMATQIDRAWGAGVSIRYRVPRMAALGIRADGALLNYGNERRSVPLSPTINRVIVDMRTMNNILLATIGPELMLPRGPVRPYVYVFAGWSYFYTQSSVGDANSGSGSFASTTNFDDGGSASGWGGGIRFPKMLRSVEAALDVGARLTHNGVRTYLRNGDIIDQPDGSLLFNPRTTAADFWQYHVGLSLSPRRRR